MKKVLMPRPGIELGPLDSKSCTLPRRYKSRLVCLSMCHFVLVFFSSFSIAITSLGEERTNFSAFRMFVRFVLVWICKFPLPLGVWEGLRFVIVALPGLFSYLFFLHSKAVQVYHIPITTTHVKHTAILM